MCHRQIVQLGWCWVPRKEMHLPSCPAPYAACHTPAHRMLQLRASLSFAVLHATSHLLRCAFNLIPRLQQQLVGPAWLVHRSGCFCGHKHACLLRYVCTCHAVPGLKVRIRVVDVHHRTMLLSMLHTRSCTVQVAPFLSEQARLLQVQPARRGGLQGRRGCSEVRPAANGLAAQLVQDWGARGRGLHRPAAHVQ